MTVSTTIIKNSHNGNGSTTNFAYQFKILQDSDLVVIIRSSTGTETILIYVICDPPSCLQHRVGEAAGSVQAVDHRGKHVEDAAPERVQRHGPSERNAHELRLERHIPDVRELHGHDAILAGLVLDDLVVLGRQLVEAPIVPSCASGKQQVLDTGRLKVAVQ